MRNFPTRISLWSIATLSLAFGTAFAQVPTQPPNSLPPSSLPPGSPLPEEPRGIKVDVGKKKPDADPRDPAALADAAAAERLKRLTSTSAAFANAAAQDNLLEVELGKLAAAKGTNLQIKEFGKHLALDHENSNAELRKIAKANNVPLTNELVGEHKAKLEEFKGKSGPQFDAAFAETIAKAHDTAVGLFREASVAPGVSGDLQSFAKKTLPTLQEHSSTAKQLHAGLAAMSQK